MVISLRIGSGDAFGAPVQSFEKFLDSFGHPLRDGAEKNRHKLRAQQNMKKADR